MTGRIPARVQLLALGGFAVGTSAYVVAGVLPQISDELDVSTAAAGQLVTAFALAYALGAPVLAVVGGRVERRAVLVAALLAAAVGNALAALAPAYPLLLVARVASGLAAAAFTPSATVVATELSPPERRGRAVTVVFNGITLALVVGVPAGNLLGAVLGYRGVFALIAGLCLLAAVAVRLALPRVAAPPPVGLRTRLAVAASGPVLALLGISVLNLVAAMSVYTYAAPLFAATAGVAGPVLGATLLAYGVGALTGNALGGRLADRFGGRRPLLVVMPLFTVVLATLPLTATTVAGAAAALFALGTVGWATNAPVQSRLLALAPVGGSGLLLSLNASAIYLGAGLAGVVGGLVIAQAGVGAVPLVAAVLGLLAVALVLRRWHPVPSVPSGRVASPE